MCGQNDYIYKYIYILFDKFIHLQLNILILRLKKKYQTVASFLNETMYCT
jgi:hypothetical protein